MQASGPAPGLSAPYSPNSVTQARLLPALVAAALSLCAQPQNAKPAAPAFDAVSIKLVGEARDIMQTVNGVTSTRPMGLQYTGVRLRGLESTDGIINFACNTLVTPYRFEREGEIWDGEKATGHDRSQEFYQVDAVAPAGTALDQARAMLRTALADRLGFRYHIAERIVPVLNLVRGSGPVHLVAAGHAGPAAGGCPSREWVCKCESCTVSQLAAFLGNVAGREVADKTGVQGQYQFNLDWSRYLQGEGRDAGPDLAGSGAKSFGLKLEGVKEARKFVVIDHINRVPTPN